MTMETFCCSATIRRLTPYDDGSVLGVIDGLHYTIDIRHSALREYLTSVVSDGAVVSLFYAPAPSDPQRITLLAARTDDGTMLRAPLGVAHILGEYLLKPSLVSALAHLLISILNFSSSPLIPLAAGMATLGVAAYRDWKCRHRADAYRHPNNPA